MRHSFAKALAVISFPAWVNSPEQSGAFIREDFARWTQVGKDGNIKVD